MTSPIPTPQTKRACDSCHRRKVKCINAIPGVEKCTNCKTSDLDCTFLAVPQKKGPKGSRAKVINELKAEQAKAQTPGSVFSKTLGTASPDSRARTANLLPYGLMEGCLQHYFAHLFTSEPVIGHEYAKLLLARSQNEESNEAYSMLSALCAFVLVKGNMPLPENYPRRISNNELGEALLTESIRMRGFVHLGSPTFTTFLTSFFIYRFFCHLNREDDMAWSYLREAITQAIILRMDEKDTYQQGLREVSDMRRAYWQLFTEERAQAIQQNRPVTLYPTIEGFPVDELKQDRALRCLDLRASQYAALDDTFFRLWNNKPGPTGLDTAWAIQIQNKLIARREEREEMSNGSEGLNARFTNWWLRASLWYLCYKNGKLELNAHGSMSHRYIMEISKELITGLPNFSPDAVRLNRTFVLQRLLQSVRYLLEVGRDFANAGLANEVQEIVEIFTRCAPWILDLRGPDQGQTVQWLMQCFMGTFPDRPIPSFLVSNRGTSGLANLPSNANENLVPYAGPSQQYIQPVPSELISPVPGQRLVPSNVQQQATPSFPQESMYPIMSSMSNVHLYHPPSPSHAQQPSDIAGRGHSISPGAYGHPPPHGGPQPHGAYGAPGLVPSQPSHSQPQLSPHHFQSQEVHHPAYDPHFGGGPAMLDPAGLIYTQTGADGPPQAPGQRGHMYQQGGPRRDP